jgi:hypothetical protein
MYNTVGFVNVEMTGYTVDKMEELGERDHNGRWNINNITFHLFIFFSLSFMIEKIVD